MTIRFAPVTLSLILAAVAVLTATSTFAASTGSITLSGTVPQKTDIAVTPITGYNALDLSTSATDLHVADVNEKNNTTLGYTVTLASQNAGQLKNGSLGSVSYTAKYGTSSVTLSSTPATITSSAAANAVVNVTKAFKVSYTGVDASTLVQGTYSDTLTFTIASP